MMENSKTGKAAEADLILGIGKRNDLGEASERSICVSKNKITSASVVAALCDSSKLSPTKSAKS